MDDKSRIIAIVVLGCVAICALVVAAILAAEGNQSSPGIAAIAGAAVGALAGIAPAPKA